MDDQAIEKDIEFLRSCRKRLEHIIEAMENLASFRIHLEAKKRKKDEIDEYAEAAKLRGVVRLDEIEKQVILGTVALFEGDKLAAAKALGIGKTTLFRRLKEYKQS